MGQDNKFDFIAYIGRQIDILNWTLKGLPNDQFSITNALIL